MRHTTFYFWQETLKMDNMHFHSDYSRTYSKKRRQKKAAELQKTAVPSSPFMAFRYIFFRIPVQDCYRFMKKRYIFYRMLY